MLSFTILVGIILLFLIIALFIKREFTKCDQSGRKCDGILQSWCKLVA